jgi:hypothetical protein
MLGLSHPIASTNTINFHKPAHYTVSLSVTLDNPLMFFCFSDGELCLPLSCVGAFARARVRAPIVSLSSIFVFLLHHSTCPMWLKIIRGARMAGQCAGDEELQGGDEKSVCAAQCAHAERRPDSPGASQQIAWTVECIRIRSS